MTHLTREQIAEKFFPKEFNYKGEEDFDKEILTAISNLFALSPETQRLELIDIITQRDQVVWDAACKEMRDQNELDLSIAMNTSQSDIDTEKWVKIIKDGPTPPFKMDESGQAIDKTKMEK